MGNDMKDQIQQYTARPKRYANVDGTTEMYMGTMMLGFSLLTYLQSIVPKDLIAGYRLGAIAVMFAILLSFLGLAYGSVKAIKRRVTYPRTGFVAYRRDPKTRTLTILGVIVTCTVTSFTYSALKDLLRRRDATDLNRLMVAAVFVTAYALIILLLSREHTWKWLVVLFMAFGLLAISLVVPGGMREWFPPASLFFGLTLLVSGGITLILYIRRTRPPAEDLE